MNPFRLPRSPWLRVFCLRAPLRVAALSVLIAPPAFAQVSITALDVPYTQNFDALPASGTATWVNDSTLPGWFHARSGSGTTIVADTGVSNGGNLYSFGASGDGDRALGSIGSGNAAAGDFYWGVRLQNHTGGTITSLDVTYAGEQWRNGGATGTAAQQTIAFSYLVGSPTVSGTLAEFTSPGNAVAALDFTSPITTATAGALNGNLAANRSVRTATISGLNIPDGAEVMLRWADPNHTGNDHGLSIDDFSVTPHGDSAQPALSIDDVAQVEGNAGTSVFHFTVSLSEPAPAGGVSFDIATADAGATAPSDYLARSLTAQTIPAGSSSYTFDVTVNGDTQPEADESFSVNLFNVVGARVEVGTGIGTILNDDGGTLLSVDDVSHAEGDSGTTTYTFTLSLSEPAPAGGVTFDIATADGTATAPSDYVARALSGQTIAAGASSYTFDVTVNGDTSAEPDETFFVRVTNLVGALAGDAEGRGTIVNDDVQNGERIHDVQGNGANSPMIGATVSVEGVVTASYQGSNLAGFFLQEEDADADADPATSEAIFVYCSACPVPVAEGQRVRASGVVSEYFGMTQITASTQAGVTVTDAGNHLPEVTPTPIALPISGDVNAFYEAREGMLVTYTDTLLVSEYFQLARFGQVILYPGQRPRQFTETSAPSSSGYSAHLADLASRRVILDDTDNVDNGPLTLPEGSQYIYHPHANGGFSAGAQGADFFRGGDRVANLTGVLHWSFAGASGTDAWRVRPTLARPATFTVANPRPASAPTVGGAIKAVGLNVLNYFTTIDTTASNSSGPCGPTGGQDCRGADSAAELARQRERTSIVLCSLNPDVAGLMEIENDAAQNAIVDLVNAVNARCGGSHPYARVNTGGAVGSDAIRVALIYRSGVLSPVGSPLIDTNAINNRPPTAQTFDVVDATNPAVGERFTVVANHLKSKGCSGASGADADAGDGQSCYASRRTQQATRLLTWINSTVIPAAGDTDVLLLGDFNSNAKETPIATLTAGGYEDLLASRAPGEYSYLFDGQLGHLDYVFASASLGSKVVGVAPWHINADEVPVFDYNDDIKDAGEAAFEEEPNGSALNPPRNLYEPGTPFRASDHDPVLVGLFTSGGSGSDLSVGLVDSPDPVVAGADLTYAISLANAGPTAAQAATLSDTLPAGTRFVSLSAAAGWSCTTPAVGASGTVSCSNASFAPGNASFTLVVKVDAALAGGTQIVNTVSAASASSDPNPVNDSASATTTVQAAPQGQLTITPASHDFGELTVGTGSAPVLVTLANSGGATLQVTTLTAPAAPFARSGGTCAASLPFALAAGANCTLTYTFAPTAPGPASQTLTVTADAPGSGTITLSGSGAAAQADVAVAITDGREYARVGDTLDAVITVSNLAGTATASVQVHDALPAELADGSWTCTPSGGASCAGGSGDELSDSATLPPGAQAVYTYSATVQGGAGEVIAHTATATVGGGTVDPNPANNSASDAPATIIVIFRDGFDEAATTQVLEGDADGFVSAQLQVEAGLLERLGPMPVVVARGDAAAGPLFTVELARFGAQTAMRLTLHDAQGRPQRSAWRTVELATTTLDLAWQPAAAGDHDGYVRLAAGTLALEASERSEAARLVRLHITQLDGTPWLSLLPN